MIEPFNLADLGFHSATHIHLVSEAERIAYRLRALYLGDVDYYPSPWQGLLRWPYINSLHQRLDPNRAWTLDELEAMDLSPPGPVPGKHSPGGPPKKRIMHRPESGETTHFSIVDRWGNAVANTYTLNGRFGSGVTIAGAGVLMNNEMDDFSIKPGVPNYYGLVGSQANAIEPGKRMLSSMSPTIVTRDGELYMVLGSPGGSRIPTSVIQVISNVIDFGMPLEQAVAAPRFHAQYRPDKIRIEYRTLGHYVRHDLEALGHKFYFKPRIGNIQAVIMENGRLSGVSDHRGAGHAIGY
jgi:gamma-glutamyltranspeptidase/glutathione hydrolase